MSWNGTVRCSHCFKTGHNRRSCPELKKLHEQALAKPEEERGYSERSTVYEFANRKQTTRIRRCTYCTGVGHNRRSCEPLKEHMAHVLKQEVAFRTTFIEYLSEIGLGVGSLIAPQDQSGERRGYIDNVPHLVTEIRWENISIVSAREQFERFVLARPVNNLLSVRNTTAFNIRAPEHWPTGERWHSADQRWQEEHYGLKVISGSPDNIKAPDGWIKDEEKVKEYFKERESWMWPSENTTGDYYKCDWWILEKDQALEESA